jgi:hypothetical protein
MVEEKLLLRHNFEYKGSGKIFKGNIKEITQEFSFSFLGSAKCRKVTYTRILYIDKMRKESASGC